MESPAKAKTISRFLPAEYLVESCMGHIRDLPGSSKELPESIKKKPWAHFAVDVDNNFHPFYCVPADKKPVIKKIKDQLKKAGELILATDEDREGESISWHLKEILKPKMPIKRMVFHEITKSAIQEALQNFRKVDDRLVQAQEARRILDRLVGYSISPFLWKSIARGLSAGRVQSAAVALVSRREMERLGFKKTKYWNLSAEHKFGKNAVFVSRLFSYENKKLAVSADFDSKTGHLKPAGKKKTLVLDQKQAKALQKKLKSKDFTVRSVEKKQISRRPPPPFITSTLQQASSRKLNLSSKQTMSLAQKLYEQGLITYMRTDSLFLSDQALKASRRAVQELYGKGELNPVPRQYKKKSKNAQEAHEAIRPAGSSFKRPSTLGLSGPLLALYDLIYKRTLAGQMKDLVQNQVRVELKSGHAVFVSSGLTVKSPGFSLVYEDQKSNEVKLPPLKKGDPCPVKDIKVTEHETKAPARYTEASLIQTLEKEGIGRPSTYSVIISTIQDRGYVKKEKHTLIPTFTALVVNRVLEQYFPNYVDTSFTSKMEEDLDEIAQGKKNHIKYLQSIYFGKEGIKNLVEKQEKQIKKGDKGSNHRALALKGFEGYTFNVGPFGPYVSAKDPQSGKNISASLPANLYPGEINLKTVEALVANKSKGGEPLGRDPKTGREVLLMTGRFGPYVTWASDGAGSKDKQSKKSVSLKPFFAEESITLKEALKLLELPKVLGKHPETKKDIKKGLGRFGPYIVHEGDFRSVPADGFFEMSLKYAVQRLKEPKGRKGAGPLVLKDLGLNPKSKEPVRLMKGRFGAYLKHGKQNCSLPAGLDQEKLDLKTALSIINKQPVKKNKR